MYVFLYSSSNTTINVTFSYFITTTYHISINTHVPCTSPQCSLTDIELCVVACSGKEEEDGESESTSELGSEGRSSGSRTSYDSMIRKEISKKNAFKNDKEKEMGKEKGIGIGKGIGIESEDDDTADREGDYDGDKGNGKGRGKGKGGEGVVEESYSRMNNHQNGWDGGMRRNGSSSFSFSAAKVKPISLMYNDILKYFSKITI